MKKDAAPSTIYEIFSNNVDTFNPDSPSSKQGGDYNPFSPSATGGMEKENGGTAQNFNAYGQVNIACLPRYTQLCRNGFL